MRRRPPSLQGRGPTPRAVEPQALRHLAEFGPAAVADVARFAMVRAPIREALRALDGAIEQLQGPDGGTLFDLPDATGLPAETPAPPWLMAMWGSALMACAEGSRVMPRAYLALGDPQERRRPAHPAGGRLRRLCLTPGGRRHGGHRFLPPPPAAWDGLAAEAQPLTPTGSESAQPGHDGQRDQVECDRQHRRKNAVQHVRNERLRSGWRRRRAACNGARALGLVSGGRGRLHFLFQRHLPELFH
ncbi:MULTISPECIES: DNA glycosylase AlkZ-like family protein [unclassified Streptomyces]|uniref:DNA glycosylase AlkZ-like family protein n=1 Tax=unclassified Streptomyces TaxID=2593676 RepID=UPI0036ED97FF